MKVFIAIASLSLLVVSGFVSSADAQGYNSQRARQDREYKSLSTATKKAFEVKTPSSTSSSSSRTRR